MGLLTLQALAGLLALITGRQLPFEDREPT
jgi:hypothetical protein